jgi:hypothetical protein
MVSKTAYFLSITPHWDNGQKAGSNPLKLLSVLALRQMKGYE